MFGPTYTHPDISDGLPFSKHIYLDPIQSGELLVAKPVEKDPSAGVFEIVAIKDEEGNPIPHIRAFIGATGMLNVGTGGTCNDEPYAAAALREETEEGLGCFDPFDEKEIESLPASRYRSVNVGADDEILAEYTRITFLRKAKQPLSQAQALERVTKFNSRAQALSPLYDLFLKYCKAESETAKAEFLALFSLIQNFTENSKDEAKYLPVLNAIYGEAEPRHLKEAKFAKIVEMYNDKETAFGRVFSAKIDELQKFVYDADPATLRWSIRILVSDGIGDFTQNQALLYVPLSTCLQAVEAIRSALEKGTKPSTVISKNNLVGIIGLEQAHRAGVPIRIFLSNAAQLIPLQRQLPPSLPTALVEKYKAAEFLGKFFFAIPSYEVESELGLGIDLFNLKPLPAIRDKGLEQFPLQLSFGMQLLNAAGFPVGTSGELTLVANANKGGAVSAPGGKVDFLDLASAPDLSDDERATIRKMDFRLKLIAMAAFEEALEDPSIKEAYDAWHAADKSPLPIKMAAFERYQQAMQVSLTALNNTIHKYLSAEAWKEFEGRQSRSIEERSLIQRAVDGLREDNPKDIFMPVSETLGLQPGDTPYDRKTGRDKLLAGLIAAAAMREGNEEMAKDFPPGTQAVVLSREKCAELVANSIPQLAKMSAAERDPGYYSGLVLFLLPEGAVLTPMSGVSEEPGITTRNFNLGTLVFSVKQSSFGPELVVFENAAAANIRNAKPIPRLDGSNPKILLAIAVALGLEIRLKEGDVITKIQTPVKLIALLNTAKREARERFSDAKAEATEMTTLGESETPESPEEKISTAFAFHGYQQARAHSSLGQFERELYQHWGDAKWLETKLEQLDIDYGSEAPTFVNALGWINRDTLRGYLYSWSRERNSGEFRVVITSDVEDDDLEGLEQFLASLKTHMAKDDSREFDLTIILNEGDGEKLGISKAAKIAALSAILTKYQFEPDECLIEVGQTDRKHVIENGQRCVVSSEVKRALVHAEMVINLDAPLLAFELWVAGKTTLDDLNTFEPTFSVNSSVGYGSANEQRLVEYIRHSFLNPYLPTKEAPVIVDEVKETPVTDETIGELMANFVQSVAAEKHAVIQQHLAGLLKSRGYFGISLSTSEKEAILASFCGDIAMAFHREVHRDYRLIDRTQIAERGADGKPEQLKNATSLSYQSHPAGFATLKAIRDSKVTGDAADAIREHYNTFVFDPAEALRNDKIQHLLSLFYQGDNAAVLGRSISRGEIEPTR